MEHIDYLTQEDQHTRTATDVFYESMVDFLEKYKKDKEAEGMIPTVELLIEDLKKSI